MGKLGSGLGEKAKRLFGKGGAVGLVILAGLLLLLLPGKEEKQENTESEGEMAEIPAAGEAEARLSELLSRVEGAGKVEVFLSLSVGQSRVLAQNEQTRQQDGSRETETETVVISRGSGGEETVVLEIRAEQYRGAVVVCEGGDDPGVVLALTRAVSAVTGLGADRITVMKMSLQEAGS